MQKGNYVDVITRKASNTLNFLQRNLSRPTVRNEQSKQLISHWFDPSWNMVVLSGTHTCRKIRISSRRSIGGNKICGKRLQAIDRAASRIQEAQLMLTTGSTRLAVSQGQQTWYHFGSIATFR